MYININYSKFREMKKLAIASVVLLFVLGVNQFIAMSATNGSAVSKEANLTGKYVKGSERKGVSARTTKRFAEVFGNYTGAVWEKSKSLDKVKFVKDGTIMVAYYNADSRLVGTGSQETYAGMPGSALADLKARYSEYAIGSVIFFDKLEANATSRLIYGTKLKEENYLIELISERDKIVVRVTVKGEKAVFQQV